jgi:hypothetical protein
VLRQEARVTCVGRLNLEGGRVWFVAFAESQLKRPKFTPDCGVRDQPLSAAPLTRRTDHQGSDMRRSVPDRLITVGGWRLMLAALVALVTCIAIRSQPQPWLSCVPLQTLFGVAVSLAIVGLFAWGFVEAVQAEPGEIRNKVTLFQTEANAADAHFPRIEFVRDSFGRVARDGILDPDITVHPGDEVTFECAGWDPEDLSFTWILVVNGLHLPFKQDGPTCLVTWRVGIEHIGEGTFVEIQLFGSRQWHRSGAGHDGNVYFRYAVLPRRPPAS